MPRTPRLTRDDWTAAALEALAERGPAAVAVEPVAARLGASKSSFYWLFDNRQALLAAALERWEREETDEVLARMRSDAGPVEQLRQLVRHAFTPQGGGAVALRLVVETQEPAVRTVAERVTRRRLDAIRSALREAGHSAERAQHLAVAYYAMYLGTAALNQVGAAPRDRAGYVETALQLLEAGAP